MAANVDHYVKGSVVQFERVLSVSGYARIPHLCYVYGLEQIHLVVAAMLTQFSNALNLVRPMSDEQVITCAHAIIISSQEDQLSVEDLAVFFRGAMAGKYGRILDRLDQQTIFALLEEYRQQRHQQYLEIKENKHLVYKGLGPSERTVQPNELAESMSNLVGRLTDMKERLKEQREINRASQL